MENKRGMMVSGDGVAIADYLSAIGGPGKILSASEAIPPTL
jgi:hypothetical protein